MTVEEARVAMHAHVRVEYNDSMNYKISYVLEGDKNGEADFALELTEIWDKYENNITYEKEKCRIRVKPSDVGLGVLSDETSLLRWAEKNKWNYPALANLKVEKIHETDILKLTAKYGRYKGLILTFDETLAYAIRRKDEYDVEIISSYNEAQIFIQKCAAWNKDYCARGLMI